MADLPPTADRHRNLPAELNCQIFYCLNVATRRKFICGLGWDFYAMFRQSLLIKSKRLCNPAEGNRFSKSNRSATISEDGLNASNNKNGLQHFYAEKGFPISVADCRMDGFPGTICYYFEVKSLSEACLVGLLHNGIHFGILLAEPPYALYAVTPPNGRFGDDRLIEVPVEARPESNVQGNVYGCGILMDPDNKVTTFFTLNGILLGKQIPISPSVDCLFPAVTICDNQNLLTFEANFGDDKDKPFAYDIGKCPGMGLDCI